MREVWSVLCGLNDTAWAVVVWGLVAVVIGLEVLR